MLTNEGILDKILKDSEDKLNLLDGTEFEGEFSIHYDRAKERILLNAIPMDNKLTSLILRYINNNDFDKVTPLAMFLGRVMLNPEPESRRDLFEFLSHNNYPIHEDGRFYAFKSVKKDGKSHHSGSETVFVDAVEYTGRIPNPDGAIISMDRDLVDDNSGTACGVGLHIGSRNYATKFYHSDYRLKVVLVDPQYVVAVPEDDTAGKMRTCLYEVVEDYDSEKEYGLAIL